MSEAGTSLKENEPKRIHAVGTIFENEKGEILILHRQKDQPEGETWGLIGGKVADGETNISTISKKIKQEIGLNIEPSDVELVETFHWDRSDTAITFDVYKSKIDIYGERISLDLEGSSEYMWILPNEALKKDDLMVGLYDILQKVYPPAA